MLLDPLHALCHKIASEAYTCAAAAPVASPSPAPTEAPTPMPSASPTPPLANVMPLVLPATINTSSPEPSATPLPTPAPTAGDNAAAPLGFASQCACLLPLCMFCKGASDAQACDMFLRMAANAADSVAIIWHTILLAHCH